MKTLDEIMIGCGSDKASKFTRTYAKPHNYCIHFEKFLEPIRNDNLKILEIGTGGGESMRGWLEYFPNAKVFGVDIVCGTNDYDTDGRIERYTFHQGDQCDEKMWEKFTEDVGGNWDFICDDGLHSNIAVITSFNALWQHVKPGGFYAVEDLNTGYGGPSFFVSPSWPSQIDFLKGKIDELNLTGGIDSIYFSKELAVLRKAMA